MDIVGVLWSILFLLSIAARTDVVSTLTYAIPVFLHIVTQLTFANVFVTDMYVHGYTTQPGPNETAALVARNASYLERKNFTAYQREMVEVHSLWYVVWLFGESMSIVLLGVLVAPRDLGCFKLFDGRLDFGALFWAVCTFRSERGPCPQWQESLN